MIRKKNFESETRRRRRKLVEETITNAAIGWRHRDDGGPLTTEDLKPAWEDSIDCWNAGREDFNARFGKDCIRARVVRDGAMSCRFVPDDHLEPYDQLWLTLFRLDTIAEKHTNPQTVALAQWMADVLFMAMIPEGLILKESGGRDTIWRRLRKQKQFAAKEYLLRLQELADDQTWEAQRPRLMWWATVLAPPLDRRDRPATPPVTAAPTSEPPYFEDNWND